MEQYFPKVIQDKKRKEFINLIQGNLSASEYGTRFMALSSFEPEMISSAHLKCRRFENVLQMSIRPFVVAQCHMDYGKLLSSALAAKKKRTGADKIKDRNQLIRVGIASVITQQWEKNKI